MSFLRGCLLILAVVGCGAYAEAKADSAPAGDVVAALHATLIDNMKHGAALGCSGRIQHVATAIDADFDLKFISQRVLRKHWDEISEDQRKAFIEAFRSLVISTYASQFKAFDGESFANLDTQKLATGESIVHARLTLAGGTNSVAFDYVLHLVDGSWRVVNVVADGVSDLALRSSQYEQIFKQRGFDGLLSWIRDQDKKTMTGC